MPFYLITLLYCIIKSLYIMQKKHRLSTYLWMTAVQKFQSNGIKLRKGKIQQNEQSYLNDPELGYGNSNGNITEKNEIEVLKENNASSSNAADSLIRESGNKLISFPSLNSFEDEEQSSVPRFFDWDTFYQYLKIEFCGKSNRSLYSLRNISPKQRVFISLGIVLYLLMSFFTYCTIRLSPRETFNLAYIQIFFFEALFALSFPNFITIVTYMKVFSFEAYLTRQIALYLLHVILIAFQLKALECLVFAYYILVILFYCDPAIKKPLFQTENQEQNTLEMYHLTFLGKIHGRFMFFYVRRVDETHFRMILSFSLNKQLQVYKELNLGNKNVHKVYYDKTKKLITIWTKSPDSGIEIALYHLPTLKCLQITSLYRSPAANVYGYENNQNKYCLINKQGHNVHLFEGNVYLTAIPIPGRPNSYDDFFVYELQNGSEILLGKIQQSNECTHYKVFRIVKEKKIWIAEDKIEFKELITHQIFLKSERILFISASWNIYIHDAKSLKRIQTISNQILPNSMYCQIKHHQEQELFEVEITKEGANFLIPDLTKPRVLAKMEKKEFNSLFFLNNKPIILCFQRSGKFFKRTVNYSLFDLPNQPQLNLPQTISQHDLEMFYTQVPEITEM